MSTWTLRILIVTLGVTAACLQAPAQKSPEYSTATQDVGPKTEVGEVSPSRVEGKDWPRFLGPNQDGTSDETGIRKDWSKGLPILWQLEVGEGYSAPTVGGRLFLFDRLEASVRLRSLNRETGELLWQTTYSTAYEDMYGYSGGPRTSPVIDGDRVYTFGPEGRLRSQSVLDGELHWDLDTQALYGVKQNFFGVGSTPAIYGDLLIAQIGGSPADSPGIQTGNAKANGSGIVAFDKQSGKEVYRLADELAGYASIRLATIDQRDWALAFTRGGLVGFEPGTGKQDFFFPWRAKKLESVNAATPVVIGDRVFITESYSPGGALLQVSDGKVDVLWQDQRRRHSLASHWATPIHVDGTLYGCSGESTGNAELRAVRLDTGEVLWKKSGLGRTSLLQVDGHFVVLGEYGELHLVEIDPKAYKSVSQWTPSDAEGEALLVYPAWNGPVLSHGILYVRGKDRLLAVELIPSTAP